MTHDRITMAANLFAAFVFSISVTATAQQNEEEILIESQALGSALQVLAEEYQLQLLFESAVVTNLTAQAIPQGASSGAALDGLLEGTDLTYQFVNERTVAIREKEVVEESSEGKARPASSLVVMARNQTSEEQSKSGQASRKIDSGDEEELQEIEQIIVTGSRIRGAQSASPLITITRQEIELAGFATVEELIDKLPQNYGAGASLDTGTDVINNNNAVGGAVDAVAGGTSINLRGLGASSTLVLLNGRRLSPSGRGARFTNISSIPVSAIERVEILTDGASAIYGSDAIGGVINFILRDNYLGAETRLRYGVGSGGIKPENVFGQSFGGAWDSGDILLTYERYESDSLANSDRDITSTSDLRRFGGTDWRGTGGTPANITVPTTGQVFAIPSGQDGTALTSADFDPTAPLNLYNARAVADMLPEQERHSAFLHVTQRVGPVELFGEAQFSTSETRTATSRGTTSFAVFNSNPFFVDPSGTGSPVVIVNNYTLESDFGPGSGLREIDSHTAVLGARFDLGNRWDAELAGNWSREEATAVITESFDVAGFFASLGETDPQLAFNPFGDGSNTNNSAILRSLITNARTDDSVNENELWSVSLDVNGKLFDLPGGIVQLATGMDYREESLQNQGRVSGVDSLSVILDLDRNVTAVYGELFFPLVGTSNSRRGIQRLEFSLAARYEDYSDFDSGTSPKVGLVWSPIETLTLRGTYGTSFRAPAMFDLNDSDPTANVFAYLGGALVDAGVIPFPFLFLLGGNSTLKAEEGTTWTAGFQWEPESIKGLSLDMTYHNIDFEDRIGVPIQSLITASNDPRFASIITLDPTPEQIAAIASDPRYIESAFGTTTTPADLLSGVVPVGAIVDLRKNNLARSVVTGMELQLSYEFETGLGSFDIGLNGNYTFDFKRQFIEADPIVDEVDQIGRPVDFRARGDVTWSRQGWSATAFVNHTDGYTDNVSDPARPIDSWTTVDLTIAYDFPEAKGFFSDTLISLSTQNLFDEDPPFADTLGGLAYDSATGAPLGRFMALQITKGW